jgi:hypothetical protein
MQNTKATKRQWLAEIIPTQNTGAAAASKSHIKCRSGHEAREKYAKAAARLLDINHWHDIAGPATATFRLIDQQGEILNREAREHDYIRIDIPGPGNPDGNGDDWVQILKVGNKSQDELQLTWITVKVTTDPTNTTTATAHFFSQPATSTFVVYRDKLTVGAEVHGRNEKPNLKTGNWFARLRNWIIYIGARLLFSNAQWKSLTRGLLRFE